MPGDMELSAIIVHRGGAELNGGGSFLQIA